MAKKRKAHKVGSSWTAMRKVGKKRRKVRITKISKKKYKVRVIGKKSRKGKRRKRR